MASVLPPDAHIDTCEVEETHAAVARRYLDEAGKRPRHDPPRPCLETLERLEGEFDFVFIDADKANYPAYYEGSCRACRRTA